MPPMYIVNATEEIIAVEEAEFFDTRLTGLGVSHAVCLVGGTSENDQYKHDHATQLIKPGIRCDGGGRTVWRGIINWLKQNG